MRLLYLMVGAPGSGKSTFIKENGLQDLTIAPDDLRKLTGAMNFNWSPETDKVSFDIGTDNDNFVWDLLYSILEKRMVKGQTVFVDATFLFKGAFTKIRKLKEKYHYRVIAIDMRHQVTGLTYSELAKRNNSEERQKAHKVVPNSVLHKYWKREEAIEKLPRWLNAISVENFPETTEWRTTTHNNNKKVYVFGDIHGCYTVLMQAIKHIGDPKNNPNNIYVFVGDYLDRGTKNVEVFKWFYERLELDNMVFLKGNHERHLINFVNGEHINNANTRKETLPQLMRGGITKDMISRFVRKLQSMYSFNFEAQAKPWLVTHAGLPWEVLEHNYDKNTHAWNLNLFPENIVVDGIGKFSMDVDKHNLLDTHQQIHGHRNNFYHDALYNGTCINLEQQIEQGGSLAIVEFSEDTDFNPKLQLYLNKDYDFKYLENNKNVDLKKLTNEQINTVLHNSWDIKNKKVEEGLWANNFTKDAFSDNRWNAFSITARGLFTKDDGDIALRGFPKFFNFNQVEDTTLDSLLTHPFPATVTKKYNGFLVLIGVFNGKLEVLSKGGHSRASEVAMSIMHKEELDDITEWFVKHPGYTILCECIAPEVDVHMVKYDKPIMRVIEAVTNEYSSKDDDNLAKDFANSFSGFKQVKYLPIINNKEELVDLINRSESPNNIENVNKEGIVIRFNDGFRTKLKNYWYLEMKKTRQALDYALKINKEDNVPVSETLENYLPKIKETDALFKKNIEKVIAKGFTKKPVINEINQSINMVKSVPYLY